MVGWVLCAACGLFVLAFSCSVLYASGDLLFVGLRLVLVVFGVLLVAASGVFGRLLLISRLALLL